MSFLSARLDAGLTQAAVAEKLGVKAASVCQWETGKTLPKTSRLREIAALYGCTVAELLDEGDAPESPSYPKP